MSKIDNLPFHLVERNYSVELPNKRHIFCRLLAYCKFRFSVVGNKIAIKVCVFPIV